MRETGARSKSKLWRALGVALVLVTLAVIVSTRPAEDAATEIAADTDVAPTAVATTEPSPTPLTQTDEVEAPTAVPTPTAFVLPEPTPEFGPTGRPSDAGEVFVLTAGPDVSRPQVFTEPDGEQIEVSYTYLDGSVDPTYDHFSNPTFFGNPLAMMVVRGKRGDEWAEVKIPTRPIMTGWVKTENYSWSTSDYFVQINVGNNTVTVWKGDEVIVEPTKVVTGDTGRTTPIASTFIDEIMPGPSGAYGPWLLSLGVFSDAINTFGGGLPKVALHGNNNPSLMGQYASNGCIRMPNDIITMLAEEVPVGTRVDIVNEP